LNNGTTSPPLAHTTANAAPDLSIVIPVYNEEHRIRQSLQDVLDFIHRHQIAAEIIVVDDGSTDGTATELQQVAAHAPEIIVHTIPHAGKAGAVLAGLNAAHGTIAGFIDADMATPLSTWFECEKALARGANIAIASREGIGAHRVGEPAYRHFMGRAFNGLVRLLLLPGIHDTQCGFKFFDRKALEVILPRTMLYRDAGTVTVPRVTAFDVELLYIAKSHGCNIAIIPITWTYGTHSKVNPLTDTLQNLRDVLLVRWHGWRGRYA